MRTIRRQRPEDLQSLPQPAWAGEQSQEPGRLGRGNVAFLVFFFLGLAVLVAGSLVKLPYAIYSPGPTVDTLGDAPVGTTTSGASKAKPGPMITVSGLTTYPTKGELRFTTVSVAGGPGYPVDVWDVLGAWIDPSEDVLPRDDVFAPDQSEEEVAEQTAEQMDGSQDDAEAVALRAIGKDVPSHIVISSLVKDSKAKDVLRAGDRLVRIGDTAAETSEAVRDALQQVRPGDKVTVVVNRVGKDLTVSATTISNGRGGTALGVLLAREHVFPAGVKVTIDAGEVGGPSAGLMFSLGLYDKLTPGALTGDRRIAGTGTIDDAGLVGPIGGIKQKMAGARAGGADYFLAPADNCPEVVGNIPSGLDVYRVATFDDAVAAIEGIASGRTSALPRC